MLPHSISSGIALEGTPEEKSVAEEDEHPLTCNAEVTSMGCNHAEDHSAAS